jgi:hypothetical protein
LTNPSVTVDEDIDGEESSIDAKVTAEPKTKSMRVKPVLKLMLYDSPYLIAMLPLEMLTPSLTGTA